jgi:transposase
LSIDRGQPKKVIGLLKRLWESIQVRESKLLVELDEVKAKLEKAKAEIDELNSRLQLNSRNSSKPPSSDWHEKPKPKSLRNKFNNSKKNGGQEGHKGSTLKQVENPDKKIIHVAPERCECGCSLEGVECIVVEKRQVFDIPEPKLEVTEHQMEKKICPECGTEVKGEFPEEVKSSAQYGERMNALLVYLVCQQHIPLARTCDIVEDLYGTRPSEGTVQKATEIAHENLADFEDTSKRVLKEEAILHVDETSIKINGKNHWVHTACTGKVTHYGIHKSRGSEAMDEIGILPTYEGIIVSDCWSAYGKYENCGRAYCNQHISRELINADEQYNQQWAQSMLMLLYNIKEARNSLIQTGETEFSTEVLEGYYKEYRKIIKSGYREMKKLSYPPKKPFNLLKRLDLNEIGILAFSDNFDIPFTNNEAEQVIRMVKLKAKISGGYRTLKGAQIFLRVRGFISTIKKNNFSVFSELINAIKLRGYITPIPFLIESG